MDYFSTILTASAITISVIEDVRRQKIPNLVTMPTVVLALAYHSFTLGINGFLYSSGGLMIGLCIFIIPHIMRGMGAGDVKLMAALGSILGAKGIIITSILVILAGFGYGLILLALNPRYTASLQKRLWTAFKTILFTRQFVWIPNGEKQNIPVLRYAVPIALGAGVYILMFYAGYDLFPEVLGNQFKILSIADVL